MQLVRPKWVLLYSDELAEPAPATKWARRLDLRDEEIITVNLPSSAVRWAMAFWLV